MDDWSKPREGFRARFGTRSAHPPGPTAIPIALGADRTAGRFPRSALSIPRKVRPAMVAIGHRLALPPVPTPGRDRPLTLGYVSMRSVPVGPNHDWPGRRT